MPPLKQEKWGDFHKVYHSDDWKYSSFNESNFGKARGSFLQGENGNLRRGGRPTMMNHASVSLRDLKKASMRDLLWKEGSSSEPLKEGLRRENSSSSLNMSAPKTNQRTKRGDLRRANSCEALNVSGHRVARNKRGGLRRENSSDSLDKSANQPTKRGSLQRANSCEALFVSGHRVARTRRGGLRRENSSDCIDKSATVRRGLRKEKSLRVNPSSKTGGREFLQRAKSQPSLIKMISAACNRSPEERRASLDYINQPTGENPKCRSTLDREKCARDKVTVPQATTGCHGELVKPDGPEENKKDADEPIVSSISSEGFLSSQRMEENSEAKYQQHPQPTKQVKSEQSSLADQVNGCVSIPSGQTQLEENQCDQMEAFFSAVNARLDQQNTDAELTGATKKRLLLKKIKS